MNILDQIVANKRKEVQRKRQTLPLSFLKQSPLFFRTCNSMAEKIVSGSGIIAEFKRRSPSKQMINQSSPVTEVVSGYEKAGASGVSVLGDTRYFGGALEDLILARDCVQIPLLRKEFIIDPYQIYEAKAFGADVILLIAAVLTPKEIVEFSQLAGDLNLEVLLEIHNNDELEASDLRSIDMVGVNNRNLKTFEVSLETSKELSAKIPDNKIKVSESGISSAEAIKELKKYGFKGFLIGENFMRTDDPGKAAAEFINEIQD